jgi:hypothetical protein
MDILIRSKEGWLLYGHQLAQRIIASGQSNPDVLLVENLDAEAYIAWMGFHYPQFPEVKALLAADEISEQLFEAVSDRIELTSADVESLREIQRRLPNE